MKKHFRIAAAVLSAAVLVPALALAQDDNPVVAFISLDENGAVNALINEADSAATTSCAITYKHGSASGSAGGSIDGEGNCVGTIPGGITTGSWSVTVTVTAANGQSGTGTTTFTVGGAGTTPTPTTPTPTTPGAPTTPGTPTAPGTSVQPLPIVDPAPGLASLASSGTVNANAKLLECSGAKVAITDISRRDGRVRILGLTSPSNAGHTIRIAFRSAGNFVSSATAAADGSFRATAPLPSRRIAKRDSTRYRASLDGTATPWLKYSRRLVLNGLHPDGTDLTGGGTLSKPFPSGTKVTITAQTDCSKPPVVIANWTVDGDGTFGAITPIPETATGFIARMTAAVLTPSGTRTATFSIARPIQFRSTPATG